MGDSCKDLWRKVFKCGPVEEGAKGKCSSRGFAIAHVDIVVARKHCVAAWISVSVSVSVSLPIVSFLLSEGLCEIPDRSGLGQETDKGG